MRPHPVARKVRVARRQRTFVVGERVSIAQRPPLIWASYDIFA
jgi:hypothetical protein